MYKMVIDKYAKNGWLKYGAKTFSSGDRLWAARRLYFDYIKSRPRSLGVIDMTHPKVDGGIKNADLGGNLEAKDAFLKAFGALNPLWQQIVERVVLEDKEIEVEKFEYKKNLLKVKKELSAALDYLILHYFSQDEREAENEKYFR